jgi:hypothetical protein
VAVAQSGDTGDPHWQAGLEWEDTLCEDVDATLPDCGDVSPTPVKAPAGGPSFRVSDPFTIYGSYTCSTGGRRASDAFDIARARLLANEDRGVERVFWTGDATAGDVTPSLADGDPVAGITPTDLTPGGGAANAGVALGLLEGAMAGCVPGAGVVHVPFKAASVLASKYLVLDEGGRMMTQAGQTVVMGAGYPGTGPANASVAADEAWLFGTGQVKVWKGDVFMTPDLFPQAMDRTLNDVTVFAERTYAVAFSCCLFAVRMTLS